MKKDVKIVCILSHRVGRKEKQCVCVRVFLYSLHYTEIKQREYVTKSNTSNN